MELISVKFIFIGLFLGLAVGGGWTALRYIISSRLRVSGDLPEMFELPVVGCISGEEKRAKWFQRPYDAYTNQQQIELIAANVGVLMEQQEKRSVFLTGDSSTDRCLTMTNTIAECLRKKGLDCKIGTSIAYDVTSVAVVPNVDAVILVEQIDVSRYEMIGREQELCERCGVPVLGGIVLE